MFKIKSKWQRKYELAMKNIESMRDYCYEEAEKWHHVDNNLYLSYISQAIILNVELESMTRVAEWKTV